MKKLREIKASFWLLAILPVCGVLLTSCSARLTPLDTDVRQENNWSEQELSKIQFYLSEDLILTRERKSGSTAIVEGRVRVKDGRNVEEIVFERGTPGVVLFSPKDGHLAIGFDARRDDRYLIFGANPKRSNEYTLLAKDWSRYSGKVSYDDKEWEVSAASADVTLLFDMRRSGTTKRKSQSVGGRRL